MGKILYIVPIAGIALLAVLVGIFSAIGGSGWTAQSAEKPFDDPSDDSEAYPPADEPSVGTDFWDKYDERNRIAVEAALADPTVKSIVDSADGYAADFELLETYDRVIISTWGDISIEPLDGDFMNGYVTVQKAGKIITVDVDGTTNAVLNTQTTARSDDTVTQRFTDNQKRAIELSLADPKVKELAAGKNYYISLVRDYGNVQHTGADCGVDECAIVQFSGFDGGALGTIVNTKTGVVYDIKTSGGWSQ